MNNFDFNATLEELNKNISTYQKHLEKYETILANIKKPQDQEKIQKIILAAREILRINKVTLTRLELIPKSNDTIPGVLADMYIDLKQTLESF